MTFQCVDNVNQFQNYSRLTINRCPTVTYFAQDWILPGLNLATSVQSTPLIQIPHPGNMVTYNDFYVTFVIDEDFKNYMEIVKWIKDIGHPDNLYQYEKASENIDGIVSDITLSILTNQRRPNKRLTMRDCFPYNISDVLMDNNGAEGPDITATTTFKVMNWEVESAR